MNRQFKAVLSSIGWVLLTATGLFLADASFHSWSQAQQKSDKPTLLRYAGTMPIGHIVTRGMEQWASQVEKRSKGRVKMELYPAGQLFKTDDFPRAIPNGEIDLAQIVADTVGGLVKTTEIMNIGMIFDDWDSATKAIYSGWDIFQSDFEKSNMRLLFLMPYGITVMPMTTKKQIKKLEDMKGLLIRGMSGWPDKALELCGATPVYISSSEVFTGLQMGTIDGAMSGWSTYFRRGWYQAGKYIIDIPYSYTFFMTAANLGSWKKLPKEIQDVMNETGREIASSMVQDSIKDDKTCREKLVQAGVNIYTPPPEETRRWKDRITPMWHQWAAEDPKNAQLLKIATKGK
jgi:C4-dicarboxylate-binding protein DctP